MAAFQHVVDLMSPLPDGNDSNTTHSDGNSSHAPRADGEGEHPAEERGRSGLEASGRPQVVELDIHVSKDGHLVRGRERVREWTSERMCE